MSHTFSAANGGEPWVNPSAFCVPGSPGCAGTTSPDGNLSRNLFTGPGFVDVDLSVTKNIAIGERFKVQLRAEMFNVFNRINLASGAGSVGGNGYVSDTIGDYNGAPVLSAGFTPMDYSLTSTTGACSAPATRSKNALSAPYCSSGMEPALISSLRVKVSSSPLAA